MSNSRYGVRLGALVARDHTTVVVDPRGTYVIPMSVQYRYTDNLLFDLRYTILWGGFFGTGFFRDRDQILARMTLLLN